MGSLDEFLTRLFDEGRVLFRQGPAQAPSNGAAARENAAAVAVLERAYGTYRLDVAGPPIPFDPEIARAAGELVRQASWALVNHDERVEDLGRRISMPRGPLPNRPSDHLSADLVLRYLPQLLRRARGFNPSDALVEWLTAVLRQWPLTGALAELDEGPTTRIDPCGHPGLALLYAERWARHERPAWRPEGETWEYVELVRANRTGAGRMAHA